MDDDRQRWSDETLTVLVLNAGSSSLKFGLFEFGSGIERPLVVGAVDGLGTPDGKLTLQIPASPSPQHFGAADLDEAVKRIVAIASQHAAVNAVGCRVVHGGPNFHEAIEVTDERLVEIASLAPLAPLHNAKDVGFIRAARAAVPDVPVYAAFDTAFHWNLPLVARRYALSKELVDHEQIRRYGFHGLSYRHVSQFLGPTFKRVVICHLGNGASVCAVLDGKSIDTSMGMTPLEGLMMGTRSGDIDPGLILYLIRERGFSAHEMEEMLEKQSGLLGVSGITKDVRELETAKAAGDEDAALALDLFCYRVAKYIGAYTVALGGLDALAFTGGIGEHSSQIRSLICDRLTVLGVDVDQELNLAYNGTDPARVESPGKVPVWIVPANEELQIAKEVFAALPKAT